MISDVDRSKWRDPDWWTTLLLLLFMATFFTVLAILVYRDNVAVMVTLAALAIGLSGFKLWFLWGNWSEYQAPLCVQCRKPLRMRSMRFYLLETITHCRHCGKNLPDPDEIASYRSM